MLSVPQSVLSRYESILRKQGVATDRFPDYKKWLRYFLDFQAKYPPPDSKTEQIRLFYEKLRQKKQAEYQLQQANHAVFLYFEMLHQVPQPQEVSDVATQPQSGNSMSGWMPQTEAGHRKSSYTEAGYDVKSDSPEWDAVLESLAAEIKVRHYSRRP
jgi:hypothetical protein